MIPVVTQAILLNNNSDEVYLRDSDGILAELVISSGAAVGPRDVTVITGAETATGGETLMLLDGLNAKSAGSHAARLELESQDAEVGLSINVLGEGLVPCAGELCDDQAGEVLVDLGGVAAGERVSAPIRIENRGDAMLWVARVALAEGALASGFRLKVEVSVRR